MADQDCDKCKCKVPKKYKWIIAILIVLIIVIRKELRFNVHLSIYRIELSFGHCTITITVRTLTWV